MAVYRLDNELWFPPVEGAEEDGLLAVGGDLSVERLLLAYQNGIFPWYNEDSPILWWCPANRFVILPDEIHVSRSMNKFMKKCGWRVGVNTSFDKVIHHCRKEREFKEGTWITDDMEEAYNRLHQAGFAMSVEVFDGEELIGGLYAVVCGRGIMGESMFSLRPNASKVALITLARLAREFGFSLIDCQFHTDHLESMGGRYIPYREYMDRIKM